MAELKTRKTGASVGAFVDAIEDPRRRKECRTVMALMRKATGAAPRMWGDSIVGYGDQHLRYDSGRELDWFVMGFSPRKAALTLYGLSIDSQKGLLDELGRHTTGKGCLYLKSLDEVDVKTLGRLIDQSARAQAKRKA